MDHRCPHRCASLFLGRNEENGIRCVYHGWKFDADGNCVDMPNVPPHQDFKDKVKAKAYKVAERNGLVWVYMGERAEAPPLPGIEALAAARKRGADHLRAARMQLAAGARRRHRHLAFRLSACGLGRSGECARGQSDPLDGRQPRARIPRRRHRLGHDVRRLSRRPTPGQTYWRFANFLFPFWTQTPQGAFDRASTAAPGSRWTTPTRCSSACRGRACRPSRAALSNSRVLPGSKLDHGFPAEHDRLVRPLAARRQRAATTG